MTAKILVINDDESIRDVTKMILEAKGYELFEAVNGLEGVAKALEIKPDLILLDIMMPEMNGYEACEKLKLDPTTRDTPILFFSSLTGVKDKIRGLELGAVDFINNIVDQGELLARVETHLKLQSLTYALKKSNEQLMEKQQALDDDLSAAAIIQHSFLPPSNLQTNDLQVASFWHPKNPLGGDIFNVIQHGKSEIILYMVDVSGHDVPSALVTVSVSQYLFQYASTSSLLSPKKVIEALEKEYPLERFDRFFTIFYLIMDLSTGHFKYSCAAHPPGIILKKNGGYELLEEGGTIIGLNKGLSFDEAQGVLNDGDKIFLYSDGIIELKNTEGESYGAERFYTLLESLNKEPIDRIVQIVYESLKSFNVNFQDDTSLIGLERIAPK